MLRSITQRNTL